MEKDNNGSSYVNDSLIIFYYLTAEIYKERLSEPSYIFSLLPSF